MTARGLGTLLEVADGCVVVSGATDAIAEGTGAADATSAEVATGSDVTSIGADCTGGTSPLSAAGCAGAT